MEGDHGTPVEVREEHEQPKRTALGVAALDMFAPDDVGAQSARMAPSAGTSAN